MTQIFRVVSVALAAATLGAGMAGCDGSKSNTMTTTSSTTTIAGADGRAVPAVSALQVLKVSIATDKTTYKTGDAIQMTISVNNPSGTQTSVSFPTGSQTAWWGYIIAQNGKIVTYEYNPSHNLAFTQNLGTDSYQPGETHTFPYAFPFAPTGSPPAVTTLPPGTYQVYARAPDLIYDGANPVRTSVPTPLSAPVTITVTQ